MEITPRRRRALSTVLAVLLAVESVSAVAAAAQVTTGRRGATDPAPPAPGVSAAGAAAVAGLTGTGSSPVARAGIADFGLPEPASATATTEPAAVPAAVDRPQPQRAAIANVAKVQKPAGAKASKATSPGPVVRKGRNHVWIPALGISRSVHSFPCDRSRDPDNYVYRWGCAGTNNVYLLGHASSVFRPLHDAYVSGRLRKGMKAYYADASGKVRAYAVRWWKVVAPTTSASWAWASLGTPSMTLQTCVGRNGQYRLLVRLVRVDG